MTKLSERVRPGCEAAPWVIEEIEKLEAQLESQQDKLAVACEFAPKISRCLCGSYKAEGYVCKECGSDE